MMIIQDKGADGKQKELSSKDLQFATSPVNWFVVGQFIARYTYFLNVR